MSLPRGYSRWPEWTCWSDMKQRCNNPNHKKYKNYGGRGIKICPEWLIFENFYKDMGRKPGKQYTLDRKDNDGNYCKENCRWATQVEQNRNRTDNRFVKIELDNKTISEWAEISGNSKKTIRERLNRGWPTKEAVYNLPDIKFRKKKNG